MAKTRPNLVLPANTWVNVYDALNAQSGEPAVNLGDQLQVENLGKTIIKASALATQPTEASGFNYIKVDEIRSNDSGDPGAWYYSLGEQGLVNVSVIE